jgi:hypothetical protein
MLVRNLNLLKTTIHLNLLMGLSNQQRHPLKLTVMLPPHHRRNKVQQTKLLQNQLVRDQEIKCKQHLLQVKSTRHLPHKIKIQ